MPWGAIVGAVISGVAANQAARRAQQRGGGTTEGYQVSETAPWVGQQPYLENMFGQADELYNRGNLYQVAPFSPEQMFAQNQMLNYASGDLMGQNQNISQAYNRALMAPMSGGINPITQAYIQSSIQPYTDQFLTQALPSLRHDAILSGQYQQPGHDLGNSIATRNLLDSYVRSASNIGAAAYNTDVNASMQAMQMAPMFTQQMMMPYNIWNQVGAQRQGMQQSMYDAPYQALSRYQNVVGGQNWGSSGSASNIGRQPYTGPSAGASAAGGALLGAQLGGYFNRIQPTMQIPVDSSWGGSQQGYGNDIYGGGSGNFSEMGGWWY